MASGTLVLLGPARPREEVEEAKRRIAHGLVRRKVTGCVRVYQGRYVTRRDIEDERERRRSRRLSS